MDGLNARDTASPPSQGLQSSYCKDSSPRLQGLQSSTARTGGGVGAGRPDVISTEVKAVYAQNLEDWSGEHLIGRNRTEYEEVKRCADAFAEVVEKNLPKG